MKKESPKKRPSNQVLEPIICKKPGCGKVFPPRNVKHVYCIPQHRIDTNNALDKQRRAPEKQHAKRLAHNKKVLEKIFNSLAVNKLSNFHLQLLQYELYNFGLFTEKAINENTSNEIEWVYDYGFEVNDAIAKTFIVHFRKTTT